MPPNEAPLASIYPRDDQYRKIPTTVGPVPDNQIRVEDKLYSTEKLAQLHPGGPLFIKAFSGRDASQAFISYHRRNFPHNRAKPALEGSDDTVNYTTEDHSDFMELCDRVNKVLPRLKSFAPWHYYVKALYIVCAFLGMEIYCHYNNAYSFPLSILMGFHMALIGLNVQHDANHGAISRNHIVNRIFGLTVNVIGGSQINWIHQHTVQHHIHTNDVHLDPDMRSATYVRMNPLDTLLKFHLGQHVYFWFMLPLHGVVVVLQTLMAVIEGVYHTPMSSLVKQERMLDVACLIMHVFRWVILPVVRSGSFSVLLSCTIPMHLVMGAYLAFFFMLSHNFEGAQAMKDTTRPSNQGSNENSFLYKQAATSSNVGGWWLAQLNGGLNYQIEHHLFPGISHCHYPTIAPIVKQFCKEKAIPYTHFSTITENWRSTVSHLYDMGSNENPSMKIKMR